MFKSQTIVSINTGYSDNYAITVMYNRTENSSVYVKLSDERSAAAHRFVISLCEEQLREEIELPKHNAKALPSPVKAEAKDADFSEEIPL